MKQVLQSKAKERLEVCKPWRGLGALDLPTRVEASRCIQPQRHVRDHLPLAAKRTGPMAV